jgi:hypothetical protein
MGRSRFQPGRPVSVIVIGPVIAPSRALLLLFHEIDFSEEGMAQAFDFSGRAAGRLSR